MICRHWYSQSKQPVEADFFLCAFFEQHDFCVRFPIHYAMLQYGDTVGFIRDLPPQLIEAFKATLEELQLADLLIHVVDVSNKNFENQIRAVQHILSEYHSKLLLPYQYCITC